MAVLRLDEIANKMDGAVLHGRPAITFRRYNIDSRLTEPGELFFAVVAGRNGHDFIPDAAEKGALGAVVSQDVPLPRPDFALVRVDDTVRALQRLAARVLSERPVKVVGITGSAGKTTTKEIAAALLAQRVRVLKSEGNLNNHLGLALSLLKLEPGHEAAVLEMAMNHAGEIRALTRIAPPDVAVVTNVHPVHLEFFNSVEDIARAKREILDGAKPGATAVLNGDDPLVTKMAEGWKGPAVTFGFSSLCRVRASRVERNGTAGMEFDLDYGEARVRIRTPFLYRSYLADILAGCGVALAFGLPPKSLAGPIREFGPFARRGSVLRLGKAVTVIDESYNSNPRALEAALEGLADLPALRKVAVLGDMLELGEAGPSFHENAGRRAAGAGWNLIITVGTLSLRTAEGAMAAGMEKACVVSYESADEAGREIPALIRAGDLVLVKGSRALKLEKVVDALTADLKES